MAALLSVSIEPLGPDCPLADRHVRFQVAPAQIVWLRGPSGVGKTMSCMHLAGLSTLPCADVRAEWEPTVPERERIGFLFQKGVLIDILSLRENIALALLSVGGDWPTEDRIASSLVAVGLSYEADGHKMPGELSGGMLRRAALAQVLAQRKRLIVLDE
jgi:ABC-type nitrate/sulfonate/bicarbonate transport system ATPase subunit